MGELVVLIVIGIVIILGFIVLVFFLLGNENNHEENYGIENKLLISSIENEFHQKYTEKVIHLMIELIRDNPKIDDEKAYRTLMIMLEDNKLKHKVNVEYTFKIFRLVKFIISNEQNHH
ncbi:hypothetical protein [Oceanirhabdus seepicola]|uniref:Uncharacterized protein n=1 Tax=Oceanirhabdus seepicola TaxID=2828781 RepID=A0A9J6NUK4_9CLOT|nr:hypothetical protein [Oceanirhabdus seepicola]MCM1988143.1 hypothetical protein [Oceanirhabdus seepicola]